MNKIMMMHRHEILAKMVSQTGKTHYVMDHIHIRIICGLFNDAVNRTDDTGLKDMNI